jgi:methionyl-tRNA formyltransferase
MHHPRVVVFGYGELGLAAIDTLARVSVTPVAVVVPGNRTGADVDLVVAHVQAKGWPLFRQPPRKFFAPFLHAIRQMQPDLLLVWSYSMLLPPELIALAGLGAVNVHGGLLPEYRGGHVMQWAIINGETETGVTLHYVDAGIDTGAVIARARFPIQAADDAVDVRARLKTSGTALLREWWPQIAAGAAPGVPQDEARARYWPMRNPEQGRIDWTATSDQICRLVRALAGNEPGAFVEVDGRIVTIRRARPARRAQSDAEAAGRIGAREPDGVRVSAGAGDVVVTTVLVEGVVKHDAEVADVLRPGASLLASAPLESHG